VDMLAVDGLLNDLPDAEGCVSGGIKVFGADVEGSLVLSPLIDLSELHRKRLTRVFLSFSATLTMCPKEGTTLMLMLLHRALLVPVFRDGVLE
jgi:hypothetical protein